MGHFLREPTTQRPRRAGPPHVREARAAQRHVALRDLRANAACGLAQQTLLVVAPNSPQRERVIAKLTAEGYEVLAARTWLGAFARTRVAGRDIDLVITDPLSPGLGGIPLTQRLRRTQPALPVVLTRLCDSPSVNGDPERPAFDDPMQPLLEEVRLLLSL